MSESATSAALRRAARRALFHLLRAGIEGVKAVEAVIDELARAGEDGSEGDDERPERVRIEIE